MTNILTQRNLNEQMRQDRKGNTKKILKKKIESTQKARLNCNWKSESVGTTESQKQLANKSLEVGKLLGLIVVDNQKGAFRRITRSLKKLQKTAARKDDD